MKERIHKVLAARGVASRRASEALVRAGHVHVNGRGAVIGEMVDPEIDHITIRGVPLPDPRRRYIVLNKPAGIVTTLARHSAERSVGEFVQTPERVAPVGRLDKETRGLLLFTNDGEWANLVTHPRYAIEKEYVALVRGTISTESVTMMESGVQLPDGTMSAPARVRVIRTGPDLSTLSITLTEGKKRQIRHMTAALGHPVRDLQRVRVGGIGLGDLPEGEWRDLTEAEVVDIREAIRGVAASGSSQEARPDRD